MKYYNNILETIGNTPLVRLNNVIETNALVLAKVETFNGNQTISHLANLINYADILEYKTVDTPIKEPTIAFALDPAEVIAV